MTKLDEAVEAACLSYHEVFMGKPPPSARGAKINAIPMKAAIQAAVPAIIPPQIKSGEITEKGVGIFSPDYEEGYNACRAAILKNAGLE